MKIGIGQINSRIGDFNYNAKKILEVSKKLKAQGADLGVFCECALTGYPTKDLTRYKKFISNAKEHLEALAKELELPIIVGCVDFSESTWGAANSAYLLENGVCKKICDKNLLPNYGVLNDSRNFDSAQEIGEVFIKGKRFALTICEDIWTLDDVNTSNLYKGIVPLYKIKEEYANNEDFAGVINISASVYSDENDKIRKSSQMLAKVSAYVNSPLIWVNAVGGFDNIIFAGGSGIWDYSDKKCRSQVLEKFEEDFRVIDLDLDDIAQADKDVPAMEDLHKALVLSIKDFVQKSGFKKVLLGLSGGIDSALVAALAVKALGSENVLGVAMPSKYSSDHSVNDAYALAKNLGIECLKIGIADIVDSFEDSLAEAFTGMKKDVTEENLQSRSRGVILMGLSNKFGAMLLTTGNKSECAVGYCTLYGDTCGGYAPICDVYKTKVYELSRYINKDVEIIPENTIQKPPSAELRPDQKDSDSLPDYDVLDKILKLHIEEFKTLTEIVEDTGFDRDMVEDILKKVSFSEWKRHQYPLGPKITAVSLAKDRQINSATGVRFNY